MGAMRSRACGVFAVGLWMAIAGCASGGGTLLDAGSDRVDPGRDASAGPVDGGVDPGVRIDGGFRDAGPSDGGIRDGGFRDGGPPDAGSDAGPPDAGLPAACASALAAAGQSFEGGASGWTHRGMDGVSGSWPFDPWEVGTPSAVGPSSCADGTRCWATDLDQNYAQCGRAELRSPTIDLGACAGRTIVMVWEQWYALWSGAYGGSTWYDGGLVEVSTNGGTSWSPVDPSIYPGTIRINPNQGSSYACVSSTSFHVHGRPGFVGSSGGWEQVEVALPVSGSFLVRFAWASGVSSRTTNANTSRGATAPGWYIDDVRFEAR